MRILIICSFFLLSFSTFAQTPKSLKNKLEVEHSTDLSNWRIMESANRKHLLDLVYKKEIETCHIDSSGDIYFDSNKQAKNEINDLYVNQVIWLEKLGNGKWLIIFTRFLVGNVDSFVVLEVDKKGINKYCNFEGLPKSISESFNGSYSTYRIMSSQTTNETIAVNMYNTIFSKKNGFECKTKYDEK